MVRMNWTKTFTMPVVSNTSPILNLAIIDRLDLLKGQFGCVYIPDLVLKELRIHEELPGSAKIRAAVDEGWLRAQPIDDASFARVLALQLDAGEAEAIALAVQLKADRLLLDESDARRIARALDIPTTGVIGILMRHYQDDVQALRQELEQLRTEANFHLSSHLLETLTGRLRHNNP